MDILKIAYQKAMLVAKEVSRSFGLLGGYGDGGLTIVISMFLQIITSLHETPSFSCTRKGHVNRIDR